VSAAVHVKPNELAAWRARARRLAAEKRCVECGEEFEPEEVAFPSQQLHQPTVRQTLCLPCRDTSKFPPDPPIR